MILYINGDEHSAAAEAATPYVNAEENFDLWWMGDAPNPENVKVSFGNILSRVLKSRLTIEAKRGQSNEQIISATKKFFGANAIKEECLAIIAMPNPNIKQTKEFAQYLTNINVKHIIYTVDEYVTWLKEQGHKPNVNGYFDSKAHAAWAGALIKQLTYIL